MYNTELIELVKEAKMLDRTLLLEERISLISYNEKGRIGSINFYDYETGSIEKLRVELDNIAQEKRREWGPEFMRLSSTAEILKWKIELKPYCVSVRTSKTREFIFSYNGEELAAMNELLANALLEQAAGKHGEAMSRGSSSGAAKDAKEPSAAASDKCHDDCANCENDRCEKNPNLVILLWGCLNELQRKGLLANLTPDAKEILLASVQKKES